jgi:ATP-binding cassette subfamily B protein
MPKHGPLPRRGPVRKNLDSKDKVENTQKTLSRLGNYLKKDWLGLTNVFILVTIATLCNLLGPFLMGKAIDSVVLNKGVKKLALFSLLMVVIYLAGSFFTWLQRYVMIKISQTALKNLREDLFNKLQSLSLRFFDKFQHGELMSRVTNDIDNINVTLTESVTQFITSILSLTGTTVVMFMINYQLAIITLLTVPLILLITKLVSKYTRLGFQEQQKNLGKLNSLIEETVTGEKVIKIYCQEDRMIEKFKKDNQNLKESAIKAQIFARVMGPTMNLVNNLRFAVIATVGAWLVIKGEATVGVIAAFINYSRQFGRPLHQIASLYNSIQSALAGAERIFEIIDENPEITDSKDAKPLEDIKGKVIFKDVTFSYSPGEEILKNISFEANPGDTVALVGPTGAGKTTIINLLTRFYDIDSGQILIDGNDIKGIRTDSLRFNLGIVLQDTYLFSETVRENIRYGNLKATDEEVIEAAKLANADHFIKHLPHGYDTKLNQEGSNLSQGQKQLLSIARTILADPAILILDEATSSIDTRTEMLIQEAMDKLMEGRTSFIIAHRLSTIRTADQILVIKDGEIVERGNHSALLQKKGLYYKLNNSRFKDMDAS